jgi:pyrroline-5-carboxylate reductase
MDASGFQFCSSESIAILRNFAGSYFLGLHSQSLIADGWCSNRLTRKEQAKKVGMKIGFIGAGQMARALAAGIVSSKKFPPSAISVSDPNETAVREFRDTVGEVNVVGDNKQLAKEVDLLFLAIKPQVFEQAVKGIELHMSKATVVSVMGGITIKQIRKALSTDFIIRVMPNTPCLVGAGAFGMSVRKDVRSEVAQLVEEMLGSLGVVVSCPESQLDAITGLSGSGPAFVFTMIEALADGGVLMGLSREVALKLASQTVFGASKMVLETGEHPAVLRDRVASPGGTTIFGLHALEDGGARSAMMDAVQAAAERSRELGG